jgi:hypothetical protein
LGDDDGGCPLRPMRHGMSAVVPPGLLDPDSVQIGSHLLPLCFTDVMLPCVARKDYIDGSGVEREYREKGRSDPPSLLSVIRSVNS